MGRIKPYDDPYSLLAARIVSSYTPRSIQRILTNSAYIKSLVLSEARLMDICGAFLDCIDQEIISNDIVRKKNFYLKQLGEFYFSELDIDRLRKEIRQFADELGVPLES